MPRKSENSIPYNEQAVRKVATAKHGKQTEYLVQGVPGLQLIVLASGSATWVVRFTVDGKRRREAIGPWGVVTLADARVKALKVAAGVAEGVDVLAKTKKEDGRLTLRGMFGQRREKDDSTAPRTMDDYAAALERDVFPHLGDRPADDITPDDFARVLEKIEDRSKHSAHKCRSGLGSTYRWAQRRRLVTVNPVAGLAFTHQSERRKRNLTDDEMAKLWNAIGLAEKMGVVTPVACNVVRLAVLTGQRNSEVAGMEVAEIKGLDTATLRWDIPAVRMKRKSDDQFVPLTKQASAIIRHALKSASGVHVFPGSTHGRNGGTWRQEHIGQETISRAMTRIAKVAGLDDVHLHDMRKVITSWLAEHGHATPEVLDAILHHGKRGVTGTHYNFALYEKQVRKALQVWADHVWEITGQAAGGEAGNVVAMVRA